MYHTVGGLWCIYLAHILTSSSEQRLEMGEIIRKMTTYFIFSGQKLFANSFAVRKEICTITSAHILHIDYIVHSRTRLLSKFVLTQWGFPLPNWIYLAMSKNIANFFKHPKFHILLRLYIFLKIMNHKKSNYDSYSTISTMTEPQFQSNGEQSV